VREIRAAGTTTAKTVTAASHTELVRMAHGPERHVSAVRNLMPQARNMVYLFAFMHHAFSSSGRSIGTSGAFATSHHAPGHGA
jgi:hypothetical protein